MLGWFTPKCPINTREKAWTETRMRWLADHFGIDRLLRAEVVLPNEDYFPDPHPVDEKGVRQLLDRMCGYMGVSPSKVSLEIRAEERMPGAAGLYEQSQGSLIVINRAQLNDPVRLLATLAHELAHELLVGGGLLEIDAPDHELVTDLLPVFLGTGIFSANATVQDKSGSSGTWSWWQISRQGYLPSQMFGYAFALFAFVRGEQDPPWARYLRLDASAALKAGLRYLDRTGDTLFHPDTVRAKTSAPTPDAAVERLRTGTPTVRLATLSDIREHALIGPKVLEAVRACLDDGDPNIPGEAARALCVFGPMAERAVPRLVDALSQGNTDTKIGAAHALGAIQSFPETVVAELGVALRDGHSGVIMAAAEALQAFGPQAESAVPRLLAALEPALVHCDHSRIESLLGALSAVTADARKHLRDYFADRDHELGRIALDMFREHLYRAKKGSAEG